MAGGQTVYASPKALYVATPTWTEDGPLLAERTLIHKFAASEPDATSYRASGQLEGTLLNQFSLSEHDGVLRAATTVGAGPEGESRVTTLAERDGVLARLGEVGGLGKGERIYAVRFLGDVGYVVTFRQVDPLYTLDLSDPRNPRTVGELKIRGYSAYLHPLGDGLLLGVGPGRHRARHDARDAGLAVRRVRARAPAAAARVERAGRLLERGRVGSPRVPVVGAVEARGVAARVREVLRRGRPEASSAPRIAEAGRASHQLQGQDWPVRRSLVVGGRLVTISDVGIERNSLTSLAEDAWLAFP